MRSSNLAYALQQEEELQQATAPVIKKLPKKGMSAKARRRLTINKTVFCTAYFALLSAALIYGKVELTSINNELAQATSTYQDLQTEYTQLSETVDNMISVKDIESQARALGMGEIRADQIQTIVVSPDNEVEVAQAKTGIAAIWDNIMTYIFD